MIALGRMTADHTFPTRFDSLVPIGHLAVFFSGLAVLTGAMIGLDPRSLGEMPVWLKPFKFSVSFAILFGTYALIVARLSTPFRHSIFLLGAIVSSGAAALGEIAYISAQAARGEASHFNDSSPYHEAMYGLMGLGATVLMIGVAVVGAAATLDGRARFDGSTRLGIALGTALTVVLTFWVAGALAGNGGRYIGLPTPGGPRIPVLGWSREVGDLRPAHFLSLHALQVLPLAGWMIGCVGIGRSAIWSFAAFYAALTCLVFFQALSGAPLALALPSW